MTGPGQAGGTRRVIACLDIDDGRVVGVARGKVEGGLAIRAGIDREAALAKSVGDERRDLGVIFDNQNTHGANHGGSGRRAPQEVAGSRRQED